MPNVIALAIPFFFALIGVELAVARWRGERWLRFADAITALGCGVIERVGTVFFTAIEVGVFAWVAARAPHLDLSAHPAVGWALAIVGVDLGYYFWHRTSHRVNVVWATHVVHHQSDDYNLAVALRQAVFAGLTAWPFYLPLALLGVTPVQLVVAYSLNLVYQFWVHTKAIRSLGPLEAVLNSPSHHRVHHGVNRRYIDKNYAGILIVWDRLFGTFEPETEPVVYGTVTPFRSWNPLWANLEPWVKLADVARRAPRPLDKLRVWFMPPEWTPEGLPPHEPPPDDALRERRPYDADVAAVHPYVAVQFAGVAIAATLFLWFQDTAPWTALAPVGAWLVASMVAFGALLEGRPWARWLEAARLVAGILLVSALLYER